MGDRLGDRTQRGVDHQGPVVLDAQPLGSLDVYLHGAEVGLGIQQQVVLRMPILMPHPQVDPGIQVAVADGCVERNVGAPTAAVAEEVVVVSGKAGFRRELRRLRRAFEGHAQRQAADLDLVEIVSPRAEAAERIFFLDLGLLCQGEHPTAVFE